MQLPGQRTRQAYDSRVTHDDDDPGAPLVLRLVEERSHRDDEGRPVREGRTPPEHLRPDDIEWKPCLYPGSRYMAQPMNVSALRQMSEHWDAMLGALGFMRAAYTEARGGAYAADLPDIFRVAHLGSSLPWFFILRGDKAPAYTAALSKATLGVGIWGARLFVKTREGWVPPPRFTSQQMLDLSEETGTLIAETEVCSGPEKMLLKFFDVLTEETFPSDAPQLAAVRDSVMLFGAHYLGFKQVLWVYYLMRRFLLIDCYRALGERPDLHALLDVPCEPPDFFAVEPADPSAVPAAVRGLWFRALADMIAPSAPDGSDAPLRDAAQRMAAVMAAGGKPPATYAELDAIMAEVLATVEDGFRRAVGNPAKARAFGPAERDRVVGASPRAFFAGIAGLGSAIP